MKGDARATAIVDLANIFQWPKRMATGETLPVKAPVERHFHFNMIRQRVDHGNTDTVQTTGSLIDLRVKFAAGMKRRHDDFESRFVFELRMRIDRYAAAIVCHREIAILLKIDIDEIGVASHRFVHGIVDDFGEKVMQRPLIRSANIHAGAAANRLKPFENLNIRSTIAAAARGC